MWKFLHLFRPGRSDAAECAVAEQAPKKNEDDLELHAPALRVADLPEESDSSLRDAKWPPDPRFSKPFSVRQIVNQQGGLIRKICSALPLSDEDLERYFLPAVWNTANFVHLLSASQDTHHRGYGGLFAHSLETALYAVNISKNKLFDFSEPPEVAFNNRGRWVLACALAGLIHDVGKAVTDITVRTKDGEVWNPNEAPLGTWLALHGRQEFAFSWNSNRNYARHPLASLDYARKLVPEDTYRYLTSAGNRNIENEMRAAVLGSDEAKNASLIAQIVRQADSLSVRLDNQASGGLDKRDKLVTSEPADKVMQTIRELIAEKTWTVNGESSCVFVTKRGTFICWPDVKDILSHLRAQGYAGAPENRDIMAGLLLDRGLFEPPPEEIDTTRRLYWPVCPLAMRDQFLPCVKVAVPERLFIGPMPAETEAIVRRLPITEAEAQAWMSRYGFVPAEDEAKDEIDAYMSGLLPEADKADAPADDEAESESAAYADLFPDDWNDSGGWEADAAQPSADAANDEQAAKDSGAEQRADRLRSDSFALPSSQDMVSYEEAAMLGLHAETEEAAETAETEEAKKVAGASGASDAPDAPAASHADSQEMTAEADAVQTSCADDEEAMPELGWEAGSMRSEQSGAVHLEEIRPEAGECCAPLSEADSASADPGVEGDPGRISEEEAAALIGGAWPQKRKAAERSAEAAVKVQPAELGDVRPEDPNPDPSDTPSSPVRSEGSSANASVQKGSGSLRKKAGRRKKAAKPSSAALLREMLNDLKHQMEAGEGPYVELGVSRSENGTLTANSMLFEKAMRAAGFDRMRASSELAGFQPPPVLSADWSKSLFVLTPKR